VLIFGAASMTFDDDVIRMSISEQYWAQQKLLNTWEVLVIVKQHLVQIGRTDGPTEFLS